MANNQHVWVIFKNRLILWYKGFVDNNQHGVVIFENILSIWYKGFVDNYTHTMRMQNMWNGCNYIIIHQKGISFTMLERY